MPIPLGGNFYPFTQITGRNFYQFSLRARQGAPHTRTGMPIPHRTRGLAHEHAPPRTRRGTRWHNMHGTPWHSVTPHAHTHSPTHWAAIVREYLEVAMADASELTGVSHSRRRIFRAS